jgi:Fe-S-cluster-containing dehydrogenase component
MAACPYGARSFNWGHPNDPPEALEKGYSPEHGYPRRVGTVEKCDFCPDMAAMGMLPRCASGCPMGAMYYGDENEDAVTNAHRAKPQRLSNCCSIAADTATWKNWEPSRASITCRPPTECTRPPGNSPAKA